MYELHHVTSLLATFFARPSTTKMAPLGCNSQISFRPGSIELFDFLVVPFLSSINPHAVSVVNENYLAVAFLL